MLSLKAGESSEVTSDFPKGIAQSLGCLQDRENGARLKGLSLVRIGRYSDRQGSKDVW